MEKNYDRRPVSGNGERTMTPLELYEDALEAKDEKKNEIAIKLAKAVIGQLTPAGIKREIKFQS